MNRNIGIVGLGLIGGSLAKAVKAKTSNIVYGMDLDAGAVGLALSQGAIDFVLDEGSLGKCDNIIIALYPSDVISFVQANIPRFKKGALIIDCAGVKVNICAALSRLVHENGMLFVGGHPMAGTEKSGFKNSSEELFEGAAMLLCADDFTEPSALEAAGELFTGIGFGKVTVTSPAEHDEVIAFTSQLAHVVSNAYVKGDAAAKQAGFSAGSYKDLTRVAWLNESMWTELFFENKDYLLPEIDGLIKRLAEYSDALKNNDVSEMKQLLADGKKAKEAVG